MSDDELDVLKIDLNLFLSGLSEGSVPSADLQLTSTEILDEHLPLYSQDFPQTDDDWVEKSISLARQVTQMAQNLHSRLEDVELIENLPDIPDFPVLTDSAPLSLPESPPDSAHEAATPGPPESQITSLVEEISDHLPVWTETACMQVVDLEICRMRNAEISEREMENFRFRREDRISTNFRREDISRLQFERDSMAREEISALFVRTRRSIETARMDEEISLARRCAENFRLHFELSRMQESEISSRHFCILRESQWEFGNLVQEDLQARNFRSFRNRSREFACMEISDLISTNFRSSLSTACIFIQTNLRSILAARNFQVSLATHQQAALLLQSRIRGFLIRLADDRKFHRSLLAEVRYRLLSAREEISRRRNFAAQEISAHVRGFLVRRRLSKARQKSKPAGNTEIENIDLDFLGAVESEIGNLFVPNSPSPVIKFPIVKSPPVGEPTPAAAAVAAAQASKAPATGGGGGGGSRQEDWKFSSEVSRRLFEQAQRNLNSRRKNSTCCVFKQRGVLL